MLLLFSMQNLIYFFCFLLCLTNTGPPKERDCKLPVLSNEQLSAKAKELLAKMKAKKSQTQGNIFCLAWALTELINSHLSLGAHVNLFTLFLQQLNRGGMKPHHRSRRHKVRTKVYCHGSEIRPSEISIHGQKLVVKEARFVQARFLSSLSQKCFF